MVVRDEQSAVRHDLYIHRAPPGLLALQPAFGKGGVLQHAFTLKLHTHDTVANFFATIPGAVLGNEYLVAVRRRKHRTSIKAHAQSSHMWTQVQHWRHKIATGALSTKLRVCNVLPMTVGETKVHAWFGGVIEFVRRHVVAEHVATIIGEPQLFRLWMPIEPYRISYATRKYLKPCPIEL